MARALVLLGVAAAAILGYAALTANGRGGAAGPAGVAAATSRLRAERPAPERLRVRVLASFPHDTAAYTQGLVWDAGALLESSGGYGQSFVRRWRPGSDHPLVEQRLPGHMFAEGLAVVGERVIQITWREGVALYRDRATLEEIDRRSYEGEGWGLCWDGQRLIMSDGSDTLTLRDPESFDPSGSVVVRTGTVPLANLNELECAEGWVYANLYGSDQIARIDPASGQVAALIDASDLLTPRERAGGAEVLNGIAYNADTETFFLTGKLWPRLFEVVFEPAAGPVRP
ncbi:MAG TPA: glutaminyl-peptide cyclotransferase [Thermoanaerobaculia bacterium]|nr:glutaminyl-peptide cyclotransferase [Thermoanaerobaculia bacterium]